MRLIGVEYEAAMPGRTASFLFAAALWFRVAINLKPRIPDQD